MNIMVKRKRIITLLSVICILALVVIVCIVATVSKPKDKTPKTYSICYHVGDAINKTLFSANEVDENYVLEELNNYPKCNNTYFCGWYLDDNYMIPAQFPITVTANVDLYAKYLQGNVSANNIAYNSTEMIYYVFGSIDNATNTLVIPDVYNDGVHGVKAVAHLDPSCSISNNPTIASLYVGNEIDEIPSGFAQNNINLTDLVLGQSVMTIDGTAFGGCTNLANINLGYPTQWQIGDDNNSSSGGWYEELGLNTTTITTSLAVTWIRKAVYVIVYNIAINPNVSTQYIGETQLDTFNSNTDNFYNADTLWNGVELRKKVEISKKQNENINLNEKVPMPYASNAYFDGWKYLPDGAEDIEENYIDVPDTMTISNSMTIYASYLKGTIASSAYTYQSGTQCFSIVVYSPSSELLTDTNSITIPDYYNNGTQSALVKRYSTSNSSSNIYKDITDNITAIYVGHEINYLGSYAFAALTSIESVELDCKISSIASEAFNACSSLTSITIPDSVTSIQGGAFFDCTSLISIIIPDNVTLIAFDAFYGCRSLTNIIIPNSVTSIESYAFSYCSSLISIIIPNNVTKIESYTFSRCEALTNISIPNSVTSIGMYAFNGCSSLTSIAIPNNVKIIDYRTFSECTALTSITIPAGVTSIEGSAFSECTSISSITIPDSVTSIGNYTFSQCTALTSITIPDSITSIGQYAFEKCSKLTNVTLSNNLSNLGEFVFDGCNSLKFNVYNNANYLGSTKNLYLLLISSINTNITTVNVNNSTKFIHDNAFKSCSSLTSINIPNSVINIGGYAFQGCSSLKSVTIPNSVTRIGIYTFYSCFDLTSINIPDSVTEIQSYAFGGCFDLNNISIPNSVTSFGSYVFTSCSGLTSISIPENVTSIGRGAFQDCSKLTSVTFANPDGWKAGRVDMSGKLTDPATNATYLVTTYRNATWQRS